MLGFSCTGATEAEASMGSVGAMRTLQGPSGLRKDQEMFGCQGKMREQTKEFP